MFSNELIVTRYITQVNLAKFVMQGIRLAYLSTSKSFDDFLLK